MLSELCKELNNWFCKEKLFGTFTISDGQIQIDGAQDGQYFRICDSVFNDGVHQYPASDLTDETFDGAIWLMAVPKEIIQLSKDIDAWEAEYGDVMRSPYSSEAFGGYQYSKLGAYADTVDTVTWQLIFKDKLNHWRKI